eukprot:1177855-Prorocentrum_minimum.AAC.5
MFAENSSTRPITPPSRESRRLLRLLTLSAAHKARALAKVSTCFFVEPYRQPHHVLAEKRFSPFRDSARPRRDTSRKPESFGAVSSSDSARSQRHI